MYWETCDDINIWIEKQTEKIHGGKVFPPETSPKRQLDIMLQEQARYQKEYGQIQQAVVEAQNPFLSEIRVPKNAPLRSCAMQKNIKEQQEQLLLLQKKKEQVMQKQQTQQTDSAVRKTQLEAQYKEFQKIAVVKGF